MKRRPELDLKPDLGVTGLLFEHSDQLLVLKLSNNIFGNCLNKARACCRAHMLLLEKMLGKVWKKS